MVAWRVLQLADAAFPTGGYVHSAGLEAMVHAGRVELRAFCVDAIAQCAHGALPFVAAAWDAPERLIEIDRFARATLWSHVAARASRAQGWALLDVAARAFDNSSLSTFATAPQEIQQVGSAPFPLSTPGTARDHNAMRDLGAMRERLARGELDGHFAPAFGFVARCLDIPRDDALQVFLHSTLRGVLSAAVRLGIAGPAEAQRIHASLDGELDAALSTGRSLALDDIAQVAPLVELHQARHDLLYSRLFQS